MIKVDLITGFLGSGKTTFLKQYAEYWLKKGRKIAILENDFGAVNVDMMLLQELEGENCLLEMVSGGCCANDHRRRFHTKLIALAMNGVERVLIEPSGIFDVDEFFDSLHEEPLDRWYEVGNVIALVDAGLEEELSVLSEYILASQTADAGAILVTKTHGCEKEQLDGVYRHLKQSMERFRCTRKLRQTELIFRDRSLWQDEDWDRIAHCGYRLEDMVKPAGDMNHAWQSLYLMNERMTPKEASEWVKRIYADPDCGHIFRVKGFLLADGQWMELNVAAGSVNITPIRTGQDVVIVIGDHLNEERIRMRISS